MLNKISIIVNKITHEGGLNLMDENQVEKLEIKTGKS